MVGRYSSWSIRKIYKKFTKVFGMLKNLYPFLSCTRYQLDIVFGSLFSLHRTLARQVSEKRLSRFFSIKYQVIGTRYWHFGYMLGNSLGKIENLFFTRNWWRHGVYDIIYMIFWKVLWWFLILPSLQSN